jgi:hypothetical protein
MIWKRREPDYSSNIYLMKDLIYVYENAIQQKNSLMKDLMFMYQNVYSAKNII